MKTMRMTTIPGMAAFAVAAALCLPQPAPAEGYGVGFQMAEEPVGARLTGMGAAGTAMPGAGFSYYNPALPLLPDGRYLTLEYGRLYGDVSQALVESAWRFSGWHVAAAFPTARISNIIPADERGPDYDLPFSSQFTMLAVSAGYGRGPFGAAVCLNGMQDRIETRTGYALTGSAGATLWVIPSKLSVGGAGFFAKTLTATRGMLDGGEGARPPRTARLGAAWRDSLRTVPYAAALDVVYAHDLRAFYVPVGVEVWPLRMLALRAGKRINHDTELFSFGCGLKFAPVACDAGFVVSRFVDDAGFKWLIGLTYLVDGGGR